MTTATATATAAAARRAVEDVAAGRALKAFYVAVLAVALVGSTQGVEGWIGWSTPFAFGATLLAELGGVALSIFADRRRQKGERALAARTLSFLFAGGAIAVQLRGHADPAGHLTSVGLFFAGFSAAGYVIYLLDSSAKRRDALRAAAQLADTPPAYGAYQWLRHPWLTRRARALAVANAEARLVERLTSREHGGLDQPATPLLGRAASLAAAAAQVAEERRLAAIRKALHKRIAAGVDPTMAKIAVHTYDLARVADGIAKGADYAALTGLLAAELTPGRIAAGVTARHRRGRTWHWFGWFRTTEPAVQTADLVAKLSAAAATETAPASLETDPETDEIDTAPTLPVVPDGARLLPVRCASTPVVEPVVAPVPPAPRTPETDPETDVDLHLGDQLDDPAEPTPALPPVQPALVPHLARVMAAHHDWHLTISLGSRHPEALTYAKIKTAAGITGQQLCADIRLALLSLRFTPKAAETYIGVAEPATAAA